MTRSDVALIIIRAKMLMQELWLLRSNWNDPVPDVICNKWKAIQSDRNSLRELELHTFTDASETAYGACAYARCENASREVRVRLPASKSRVAPLKRITLIEVGAQRCCFGSSSTPPRR
uniref:Uncharacterized protein n=1 Tax=Anopheles stephensi TaxID=30069 RepID=A0A182YT63_ANOST